MTQVGLTQALSDQSTWPLYTVNQTQAIEQEAHKAVPTFTLMQRAGLATAQLALAIAPHAQKIWIACGPGNNGGDGLEAAAHLQAWGKQVVVSWLGKQGQVPKDAQQAWQNARAAGVEFASIPPLQFDLAVDALLGIGTHRAPDGIMATWLQIMQDSNTSVLCVDMPSGLLADTGQWLGPRQGMQAKRHTLTLLTLKPGLFTADGHDASGQVWFNDLGVKPTQAPSAWLQCKPSKRPCLPHNSHKGTFGDVCILGGAPGMAGAAVLSAIAALHGHAGRVYVGLLDHDAHHAAMAAHPSLMIRDAESLPLSSSTVVCGCGGGDLIQGHLPKVLSSAPKLVLDADALNAIARDTSLQILLKHRQLRQRATIITPHPLEAARLLGISSQQVQSDRLGVAQHLANEFQVTVVLKGAGSIVASPSHTPTINFSGNAQLATAGTGDVLSGLIGAYLAHNEDAFEVTCRAVFEHGHVADTWPSDGAPLDAATLAARVR